MEKNASVWLEGGLLFRPPSQLPVLAERGSDCHTRVSTTSGSWVGLGLPRIQKAAAPGNHEGKSAHAGRQLTSFMRQNGKSLCSGDGPLEQLSRGPPSISRRAPAPLDSVCALGQKLSSPHVPPPTYNWPLAQPPPCLLCKTWALLSFWQELIPPVGFSLISVKWGEGGGKANCYLKLKPKSLTSSLERALLLGLALLCQVLERKAKARRKAPGCSHLGEGAGGRPQALEWWQGGLHLVTLWGRTRRGEKVWLWSLTKRLKSRAPRGPKLE